MTSPAIEQVVQGVVFLDRRLSRNDSSS